MRNKRDPNYQRVLFEGAKRYRGFSIYGRGSDDSAGQGFLIIGPSGFRKTVDYWSLAVATVRAEREAKRAIRR